MDLNKKKSDWEVTDKCLACRLLPVISTTQEAESGDCEFITTWANERDPVSNQKAPAVTSALVIFPLYTRMSLRLCLPKLKSTGLGTVFFMTAVLGKHSYAENKGIIW